jgi:excisionase family DNA binding protein
MATKGEIPAVRIGREWRFEPSAIDQWIASNRTGPQESDKS